MCKEIINFAPTLDCTIAHKPIVALNISHNFLWSWLFSSQGRDMIGNGIGHGTKDIFTHIQIKNHTIVNFKHGLPS